MTSDSATPIKINQDANIYVSEIAASSSASIEIREGRQAYLLCMEGSVLLSGGHGTAELQRHDAAEIFGPNEIVTTPANDAPTTHLLLVEMEYTGKGRSDL